MSKFILPFLASLLLLNPKNLAQSVDGTVTCPFGALPYRVYYPENYTDTSCVIHVSRGGNGLGDDRGQLLSYVEYYVQNGYVVVQVDHRFAGSNIEQIAQYRGEEIKCICETVASGNLNTGNFQGKIEPASQGFAGHSGGCMEGLEAAGTLMSHGNYQVPQIKAVYGMSPAGYLPDQFGIINNPPGFANIQNTAIFLIVGEEEKDVNGGGTFMANDWRLQAYDALNESAPRFEAFVKGTGTAHNDIAGNNIAIRQYNQANSLAFFNTYLKGMNQLSQIGHLSIPPDNQLEIAQKGVTTTVLSNLDKSENFQIIPNPSHSALALPFADISRIESIKIFNATGCFIMETQILPIDITSLVPGAYFIQITEKSGRVQTLRFFKI